MGTLSEVAEKFSVTLFAYLKKTPWSSLWKPELRVYAAALAYTTVVSLVPLLAVIFALLQFLGFLDLGLQNLEPLLYKSLAPESGEIVIGHIEAILVKAKPTTIGALGMFGLVLTTYLMFLQVNRAVNTVVGAPIRTNLQSHIRKLLFIFLITPIAISISIALSAYLPIRGSIMAFALDTLFFASIYKIIINKKLSTWSVSVGASLTALAWELTKIIYSVYTRKALLYSAIYGSLSAVPLFLLWIYLAWTVFLLGATAIVYFDVTIKKRLTTRGKFL